MPHYSLVQPDDVVVVGGAGGIGRAIVQAYSAAGCRVFTLDQGADPTELVDGEQYVFVDITDPASVAEAFDRIRAVTPSVGAVVDLAGIVRLAPPETMSLDAWREVTAVNLDGAFLVAQAASPMLERGGRLVVFSSMSGAIANKGRENTAYCASKAGVVGLVKSLAALWAPRGVTVNAVSPGYVGTEVTRQRLSPDLIAELEELTPLARMGEPGDMVAPTLFLTSEQAGFVTGHVLVADGGYTVW